jgi:predicted DNA-binding transcriptional regulator AlpA
MDDRIAAPHVARLIGIKTPTLAKWRCLGKGPRGWIRISPTHVTYPRSEVEKFLAERAAKTPIRA